MVEATEQSTEPKVSKENNFAEGTKDNDFEPQWEMVKKK